MKQIIQDIHVNDIEINPKIFTAGTRGSYGIYKLNFIISEHWDDTSCKIVFYPRRGSPIEVAYTGQPIDIPYEVMQHSGIFQYVFSGFMHKDDEDEAKQISLPGEINVLFTLDDEGKNTAGFTLTVAEQILSIIGPVSELETKDRLNIVKAINELVNTKLEEENDPTVPDWAKKPNKPTYDKSEIGLDKVENIKQYSEINPPPYPVTTVNGKNGDVQLSAKDVNALPADTKLPTKTSDITNDSGFITRLASDLTNYYLKSETYSKVEINAKISAIPKFTISVVSSLPTSNISETTVYLVNSGSGSDLYTEYIYVNGKWEVLGSQKVDLTGYATETWVNTELATYLPRSELQSAINTALAQAKASGEFDGKDGQTPYIKDGYWWIGNTNTNVKAEGAGGINFTPGNALELTEDGTLNVLTATDAESDNTLPITSAAVAATVGNIEILLKTI